MNPSRELLIHHLRELLAALENPDFDLSQLPLWLSLWFRAPTDREIAIELRHIQHRLAELAERRCPLTKSENANTWVQFMTGVRGQLDTDRKDIRRWLVGATRLTIADPYFFLFGGPNKAFKNRQEYTDWQLKFMPNTLKQLEIFHLPRPTKGLYSPISNYCKTKGIVFKTFSTKAIHDRVLIKDASQGRVIGTSFNSLGSKIGFVLDLPEDDLKQFRQALHDIKSNSL